MANILITGNEGFVGRHFQKYFESQGNHVTGLDIKSGNDCRDYFKEEDFGKSGFDLVIHAAAIVGGREMIENEPLSVATDLAIDADMFNWAIRTHQPRIVYFSSSAAYPIDLQTGQEKNIRRIDRKTLRENDIDFDIIHQPDMTYGWTKLTGEFLAEFARKKGVKVHVVRPFSGYGADQDETYPFPMFIKRVKEKQDPFEIWGDGTQTRDFIHIDDIVNAVMKMIELEECGPLNLGTGIATSFTELAFKMFEVANWFPMEFKFLTDKPVGVMYRVADISKMSKIYTPQISLTDAIKKILT